MPGQSNVVEFTITFGSRKRASCGKTCRRACWLNLETHPAPDESAVRLRTCSRDMFSHLLCGVRHSERSRGIPVNCLAILLRNLRLRFAPLRMTGEVQAERIGIEPTPVPGMRNRQRF